MPIDYSLLAQPNRHSSPTDPLDLFRSLKVTDPAINDLWLAQGDALRRWHESRRNGDVAIRLNTGAGKTLVGLLIAQSLVNETNGRVVYACSSIQLVEQTRAKAEGYGLQVSTYYHQQFNNDLFHRCLAPCITTYQALFNGMSRFFGGQLAAIVFDDAHTAESIIRNCFTLSVTRRRHFDAYANLVSLFRPYFDEVGLGVGYTRTIEGDSRDDWFVPPFVVRRNFSEVARVLIEADLASDQQAMFAWAHLENHLDTCAFVVSGDQITITPAFLPTKTLPYFRPSTRRVYLSATLSTREAFLRVFGCSPDPIICPTTTAGECERLILMPSYVDSASDGLDGAKRLMEGHKTLVLVPSYARADRWRDVGDIGSEDVAREVEDFKSAQEPRVLVLVARYDGIDLPGDTCRLMVIDGSPSGVHPLERFLWNQLGLGRLLRYIVASRLVQSFGRISRGMSDHGVVVVVGEELVNWILAPDNQAALPEFLAHQIGLGITISHQARTVEDLLDARDRCLQRDEEWLHAYQQWITEARAAEGLRRQVGPSEEEEQILLELASAESSFAIRLWERDFEGAAESLHRVLDKAFRLSPPTGAWYAHWLGFAYDCLGDNVQASILYHRAHKVAKNLPPFPYGRVTDSREISPQVSELIHLLFDGQRIRQGIADEARRDLAPLLAGEGSSNQIEEAIRALGQYLGFDASRPDNEFGVGPDVLWIVNREVAIVIEVKSDKLDTSVYRKADIGQLHDHIQWVRRRHTAKQLFPVLVGPSIPVAPQANPPEGCGLLEVVGLRNLANRLVTTLGRVASSAVPANVHTEVEDAFRRAGLLWPDLLDTLNIRPLEPETS